MDDNTSATMESALLRVPPEILLIIVGLLDVPDVMKVRQTCMTLCKITYERTLWISLLQDQEKYLPIRPEFLQVYRYREDEHAQICPTSLIEASVVKSRQIAEAWPRLRSTKPNKSKKYPINAPLMILKLLSERWLVAMYFDGVVRIYDTHTPDNDLRASLLLEALNTFPSHALSMDYNGERLILVISHSVSPYVVQIYQFNFSDLPSELLVTSKGFDLVQVLVLPVYKAVKAIDTTNRLLILATTSEALLEVVSWDEDYNDQVRNGRVPLFRVNAEDVESLWNGVVAARFFGSHILVSKARSLEIYRYKDHASNPHEPPGLVLKHSFNMTFRDVSFSDYSVIHDRLSGNEIYEMNIFACDVIQGLFHYTVRLSVPSSATSQALPFLNVVLTSVYPLAQNVLEPLPTSVSAPAPLTSSSAAPMTYTANFSPSPGFTHTHLRNSHSSSSAPSSHTQPNEGNHQSYGLRGFLSAQCLGPQGKRGMWVERKRTSTVREVQVWSRDPPISSPSSGSILPSNSKRILAGEHARDSNTEDATPYVSEMEPRVIYTLHSYDLRDDITMCTFGELGGTIALGHRSGEISIIKLEL